MSSQIKTIAVIGATGNQGSSVVKTFLSLPNWHVRAITRSPESETAIILKTLGAEIVQADLLDSKSLEEAFAGAHAIFVNTDFWGSYRSDGDSKKAYDLEVLHGKNAADAAARIPTLERFVYSALGPMSAVSKGKYPDSYHWEAKAATVSYISTHHANGLAKITSEIYLGAYNTNPFLMPKLDPSSGQYVTILNAPETLRFPIIDATTSTGIFVRALVEDEEPGTKLLAYDSYLSVSELLSLWSRLSGKEARFIEMGLQEMHDATGVPLEVLCGPAFISEFGYMAGIDGFIEPGQLKKKVNTQSFEKWLGAKSQEYLLSKEMDKGLSD